MAFGIFQVVMDLRTAKQRKVIDRLTDAQNKRSKREERKASLLRQRASEMHASPLDSMLSRLHVVSKFQQVLDQADVNWSASRVLTYLSGGSLLVIVGGLLLQFHPFAALAAGVGLFCLPLLVLVYMRKRRIKQLVQQLPDVFELMSQALRAGHSLASAIQLVSEQMPDPISGEFAHVFHEQNLGIKIEEALLNMANRVDQMDVRFFVTAVLIQRQTGGDLAEVLDKIGGVIRDRIQLFGAVQALTAEGRLSGWVLLLLPVLVFFGCMYVNPEYAQNLLVGKGKMLLVTAAVMDLMGMAMIRKIVNIKV